MKKKSNILDRDFVKMMGDVHQHLARQTIMLLEPEVERIFRTKSRDIHAIEHLLDSLCDLAFDPDVLLLFKKLCRYYYTIDPQATFAQVHFYRYLWDSENLKKETGKSDIV
jgi:hypothetical protein